jgi:hypothetical protein
MLTVKYEMRPCLELDGLLMRNFRKPDEIQNLKLLQAESALFSMYGEAYRDHDAVYWLLRVGRL